VLDQDYEMFEQQTPHLLIKHEFLRDSGGAGRWRGGLGVETRIKLRGEGTQVVTFGDGDVEPAFGLFGGGEGTLNYIELQKPGGETYRCTSKDLVTGVPDETLYVQEAGGGGGYGDPFERPAGKVFEEVRNGIISIEKARELYGVVVDEATMTLDEASTGKLRAGKNK
jgi:N-methylhydantoinase B